MPRSISGHFRHLPPHPQLRVRPEYIFNTRGLQYATMTIVRARGFNARDTSTRNPRNFRREYFLPLRLGLGASPTSAWQPSKG
jgi:hypothetical protein